MLVGVGVRYRPSRGPIRKSADNPAKIVSFAHLKSKASVRVMMAAGNAITAGDVGSRTISKLRRRLIPLLFLLYVVAYLDRINIGFASLTMNTALAITSAQFGLLLGIFFWGLFRLRNPQQSSPPQDRRAHLDCSHPDQLE